MTTFIARLIFISVLLPGRTVWASATYAECVNFLQTLSAPEDGARAQVASIRAEYAELGRRLRVVERNLRRYRDNLIRISGPEGLERPRSDYAPVRRLLLRAAAFESLLHANTLWTTYRLVYNRDLDRGLPDGRRLRADELSGLNETIADVESWMSHGARLAERAEALSARAADRLESWAN